MTTAQKTDIRQLQTELHNIATTGKSMISCLRLKDMGLVRIENINSKLGKHIGSKMILTEKAKAYLSIAI